MADESHRAPEVDAIGRAGGISEKILRTEATAGEALACIVDVVTDGAGLGRTVDLTKYARSDVSEFERWLRSGLAAARVEGVAFASLVVLVPDGPPYALELILTSVPATPDGADWADHIVLSFHDSLLLRASAVVLGATATRSPAVTHDADYIVPLAYAAFVLRDALGAVACPPGSMVMVSYHGGDALVVPPRARGV